MEFIVNVGVIAPAAALGSVVWPRTTWRDWTAYGFLFSASIELTQGLLLPTRSARFDDIVANTLGALVGAALVLLVQAGRRTATLTGVPGSRPTGGRIWPKWPAWGACRWNDDGGAVLTARRVGLPVPVPDR